MGTGHVVIVGAGFAGLAMGIRLKQSGFNDFTIVEQDDGVGGTWRVNHYPGAACDIESHLYSFSFAPNPDWSRTFAPQREILAYLERCTDTWGLRPHLRLNTAVTGARFDEASGTWRVDTSAGDTLIARVLIPATGGLSRPSYPDIPGLSSFAGQTFHSARWNHEEALTGKRVAVIGTGASAIQIVPAIAPEVGKLHLFQRTPPWIVPRNDRALTALERTAFRHAPALQQGVRALQYLRHELLAVGFVMRPELLRLLSNLALYHLRRSIPDPVLREKLRPDYVMGCKRILLSDDYYPSLLRDNVELVTEGIREIVPNGVVTSDGEMREVDALVLATGFQAADAVAPFTVTGRNGRELNDAWRNGAEAYLGTTVAGFPNLFLIVGPNTGLGHSSMVFMIESQVAYILDALRTMQSERLSWVDVQPGIQATFNDRVQERMPRTVWASGCRSWYFSSTGRNTTLWPGFTFEYRLRTRRFDVRNYDRVSLSAAGATAPASVARMA